GARGLPHPAGGALELARPRRPRHDGHRRVHLDRGRPQGARRGRRHPGRGDPQRSRPVRRSTEAGLHGRRRPRGPPPGAERPRHAAGPSVTAAERTPHAPDAVGATAAAVRAALGVGLAVSAYGVSFGALAVASGLDIWQTCVLSLLMFSGGSQFALIGVLATGGVAAGPAAIASATLLGIRNGLYSMRMSPIIGGPWWRRVLAGHWTIDETTAVGTAQPTLRGQRVGFWVTGAVIYLGWNLTTLAG